MLHERTHQNRAEFFSSLLTRGLIHELHASKKQKGSDGVVFFLIDLSNGNKDGSVQWLWFYQIGKL